MKSTIEKFYQSFKELDAEAMASCYHESVVFKDPAFGELKGERAKNMWRMLCKSQKGQNFHVSFSHVGGSSSQGSALWEARYKFSKTGRKVYNKIEARFEFRDGLISKHTDSFNLHSWAKQALGFRGLMLGGTNFFQRKLQRQTNKMLDRFIENQNSK